MHITTATLAAVAARAANPNMASTVAGLACAGVGVGLNRPVRLAHYLAQLAHESGGWVYDREVWGPTAAQKRYDTRTDLGNTAARDGDGYMYRGRGPIQITGKTNYRKFTAWAQMVDKTAPDFVAQPDLLNTDPWEGLAPIWFWDRNGLNAYADKGDALAVSNGVNRGNPASTKEPNGLADRKAKYLRAALVLLGHGPADVRAFQRAARLTADDIAGPKTHIALHAALKAAPLVTFDQPDTQEAPNV